MALITPKFRVSFPNVFEAKRNELSGKDEFSLVALFEEGAEKTPEFKKLIAAVEEAKANKWGADKNKWPKNLRSPFRNQGEKAKEGDDGEMFLPPGHVDGAVFLNLKSQQRPQVVDQSMNEIIDKNEFYPGCWARASVSVYAYDQAGNKGVSLGLKNIQKVADGEPFGGRTRATDDFSPVEISGTEGSANSIFG